MNDQHHATDGNLQHHFDTPAQQFDASKLGMWLFLATEILLFGGLFCGYAVYRANSPEVFAWAHHLLDTNLGAINTVVLLCSSLTMAWAVRCAQLNNRKGLVVLLALTLAGGFGFLGIKYVEYQAKWKHGLLWGRSFAPDQHYVAAHFGAEAPDEHGEEPAEVDMAGDPVAGKNLFLATCYSCHGPRGRGIPRQGANLVDSEYARTHDDRQMLDFLKIGRQPFDPQSTMKLLMPPRGGNPTLTDEKLVNIIAYVRELQAEYEATVASAEASGEPLEDVLPQPEETFLIQRSVIPEAPAGPPGLSEEWVTRHVAVEEPALQPSNVQVFFSV